MKAILVAITLVFLVTLFSSCELDFGVPCLFCYGDVTPIKKGLKTTVSGSAFDYNLNKPIIGVKIYLEHLEDVGYRKATHIDSTFTDSNGNYSFHFTTDGIAYGYELLFRPTPMGHYETYSFQYEIHNFGNTEIINFDAARLSIAEIKMHVVDNPNPPLRVYTRFGGGAFLYEQNVDTTAWVLVMPNAVNQLYFNITNPDTASLYNYQIEKINLIGNFNDTVYREYTVHPKEFKKRG